jgi:PAS domain S-box-containing protein
LLLTQQALKLSESRFRSIAEAMTNPLLISRLSDGIILYVNQRLYDALKLRNTDLVGKPAPDFYAHPEQRKKLKHALQKQGHVYNWELELVRPNGEHFWVMFSASTINYDGEVALIASYVDITELNIAQEQLLQSAKMAALGEMSAGVAHEINTPLATILLSSHNIRQAWKTKNYAELKKNLDLIDEEVNRTSTIIRQMLNFSRNAELDKWVLIDVRKTMEQIILMLKRQFESEGIEIILKLGRQPLYVNGNSTQLQQVFYNLASNAKDAVRDSSKKEIQFRIKRRKAEAIFEIEDSGEGIAPKDLHNIFAPFFTTKPLGKGTGLGLSVSNNIIKKHNGSLECINKGSGNSTLFRASLPLINN